MMPEQDTDTPAADINSISPSIKNSNESINIDLYAKPSTSKTTNKRESDLNAIQKYEGGKIQSFTPLLSVAAPVDLKPLINSSVTMNLSDQDRRLLFHFVKSFIQSAEAKSVKVPPKSTLDYMIGYGATGLLAGVTAGLSTLSLVTGPSFAKFLTKLVASAAAGGVNKVQEEHLLKNHHLIKMKISQVVAKGMTNEEKSMARIFRLFYANVATDIFLRFKHAINAHCALYDENFTWIENMGGFAGSRFFHKLKRVEDKKDAIREFIRSRKSNNVLSKFKAPKLSWLCSEDKVKIDGTNFRSIFLQPQPAGYFEAEMRITTQAGVFITKVKSKSKTKSKEVLPEGKELQLFIRPPFEFEQNEMLDLLKTERDKLQPIDTPEHFNSTKSQYIWEDCTPLAIEVFEELDTHEEFNPTKHVVHNIQKFLKEEIALQMTEFKQHAEIAAENAVLRHENEQLRRQQGAELRRRNALKESFCGCFLCC